MNPSPPLRFLRDRRGGAVAVALVLALAFTSFAAAGATAARPKRVSTCATLAAGAVGPAVVTVQQLVKTTPDGEFGPLTAAAVTKWQRRHDVKPTGVVDAATWDAMPDRVARTACAQQVHGSGVAVTCAHLRLGATGPAVEVLQQAVGADVDGEFGPLTAAAVRAARAKAKLKPRRVANLATWAALGLTGTPACTTAPVPDQQSEGGSTDPATGTDGAAGTDPGAGTGDGTASPTPSAGPTPAPTPSPDHLTKKQRRNLKAQQAIADEVAELAAELLDAAPAEPDRVAHAALHFARRQKGKPYGYGTEGPKSYDCSGLVMTSYLHAGLTLPRVAADQYAAGGKQVPLDQARPGDLLFYADDLTRPETIHHVVIYLGDGRVIDAPYTGAFVGVRPMWTHGLLPVVVRPVGQLTLPLRPGASGWAVGQLQQVLNRHGAALPIDGGYGPGTLAAVRAWKAGHGLKGNGVVNRKTWLTFAHPKRSAAPAAPGKGTSEDDTSKGESAGS